MATKVVHITSVGDVAFSQNPRSKSIRLSVKPGNKVTVSYPLNVSFREAHRFAEEHRQWIFVQQQKFKARTPDFSEDSYIQTRFHQITFRPHGGSFAVRQLKFHIEISYPEGTNLNDPDALSYIEKVMTSVFRWEARKILPPRMKELSEKHNFPYGRLSLRNNKTNWGSCSGTNNISLNINLAKLPDHLIDFIILHELVHTKVKNHGPGFWKMLDSVTGMKAKQLTREIRKHSTFLTL